MQWIRPLFVAATIALAGCASTYLAKPAENKNHAGYITAAKIIWVEPVGFQYSISKAAAGYGYTPSRPIIDDRDKQQAEARMKSVIDAYRARSQEFMRKALETEGVAAGDETKIYIQPVYATIEAGTGTVKMAVRVSVHHADAVTPWIITPVTQNTMDGPYWNVLRKPVIGDTVDVDLSKLVESFANTVARQMRQAGWFR